MSLPLKSKLGSYEVRSRLGAGGMGEVYLAYDTKLGRPVALKILPTEFASDRSRMQRFIQEAQAASALNHPNIITIYEIEEADSVHFIATEFVDGETLHQRSSRSQLLIPECLDIVIQVASALAAAHAGGIVHRDVKPENIMLRRDGLVKLLDFGLAKLTATTTLSPDTEAPTRADVNSVPGIVMGTLPYMSPEQARGLDLDVRTDIWSLGCVLYEIVTGHLPFTGDTPNDVLATILKTPPAPLSRYRQDAPAKLEEIVVKTLEKSREDRYQSVADLLVDLRRLKRQAEFEAELARSPGIESVRDEVSEPPRHNLPAQRATVVGRDREIEEICARVRSDSARLLTLTGVGGTGKTTLARAVAEKLLPDFADGVFFIDLAAVKQAELVASTIAQPLGVKEGDSRPIFTLLKEYLGGRHMLLVLDNFEQVLSAGPVLAELLTAAPSVKMLVTSRALLQLTFEQEYMVPPLESPRNFADGSPDELIRYDAVKLFVDRTRAAKPNFVLTTDNARTVAGICARLEGLPLGIELAAARMKLLSPQAILARLADRLKLLTGGPLDLPTRQQTMRSTMEWSYDLLTDDEKQLFRRLAVFAGGFSLDSAQKVVGDHATASADQAMDVLDGLTSLVNKSLLVPTEQASEEVRFRMLAVVREYALDRLEESGEAEAIRQSHAAYFLAFAEEAEPMLQSAQPAEWLRHLDEEYDNIREALRWSLAKQPETAARLAGAVRYFWDFQGRLTEGLAILKEILSLSDGVPTTTRCKMLSMAGNIAKFQGDHQTARTMYEEGLRESRVLNDLAQVSLLCRGLGSLAVEQGDLVSARTLTGEALAAAREANDQFGIARSLNLLGDMARTEGDYPAARPLLAEALEICRATGNKYGTANICNNLAAAEYGVGDYASARAHFAEGLTMAVESGSKAAGTKVAGDKIAISYSLDGFAALAIHRGEAELAAWLAGAAQQLRQAIHFNIEPAERRFREGYLASIRAALSGDEYRSAYEQGGRSNLHESVALALGRKL